MHDIIGHSELNDLTKHFFGQPLQGEVFVSDNTHEAKVAVAR